MRTEQLAFIDHLFVSPAGLMLPEWQLAFSGARAVTLDQLVKGHVTAAVIWLRVEGADTLAEMVGAVHAHCGPVPVVVLSDIPNDDEALASLSVRARGYCNSHAGADLLAKVALVVSQGGLWIGESLMDRILAVQQQILVPAAAAHPDWRKRLTAREVEVAQLAAAGIRYKEIARELFITERTVKAHMGAILDKLELRDKLQLALMVGERQRSS